MTHYSIESGNSHPQQDPACWVIYCRKADDLDGDWELLDTETAVEFDMRHEEQLYALVPTGNIYPDCAEISFVFTDIRDAQYQGGAGINADGVLENRVAQLPRWGRCGGAVAIAAC